jgi:hypothetical protein
MSMNNRNYDCPKCQVDLKLIQKIIRKKDYELSRSCILISIKTIEVGKRLKCQKCELNFVQMNFGEYNQKLLMCSICRKYLNNIDNDILIEIGKCHQCSEKCRSCGDILDKHSLKNYEHLENFYCEKCYVNISNPSDETHTYTFNKTLGWELHSKRINCLSCKKDFQIMNKEKKKFDTWKDNKCKMCDYNEIIAKGTLNINLKVDDVEYLKMTELRQKIKQMGGLYPKNSKKKELVDILKSYLLINNNTNDLNKLIYFGKYLNKPLKSLLVDEDYVNWLFATDWFKVDYPDVYDLIFQRNKIVKLN